MQIADKLYIGCNCGTIYVFKMTPSQEGVPFLPEGKLLVSSDIRKMVRVEDYMYIGQDWGFVHRMRCETGEV